MLDNKKQVKKRHLEEKELILIYLDSNGIIEKTNSIYGNYKSIYQEFYELNNNGEFYYQPNVFFAYESYGLRFRRGEHNK